MIYPACADIVPFLSHTVAAFRPFAATHGVRLEFEAAADSLTVWYEPKQLVDRLSRLICEMTSLMPCGSQVTITAAVEEQQLLICLQNTGIDLSRIGEITRCADDKIEVWGMGDGTRFRMAVAISEPDAAVPEQANGRMTVSAQWRGFYGQIKHRLRSHFSKAENLVALLSHGHPKDAAFLQKVNALIQANMEDDRFDSAALGRALCLSRTQLFRKLKPLIRQAPAQYIRVLRLEKAKELLETSELNIGEVTFKTGFQSQSHFTKAFTHHYGVAPSLYRRKATK